MDKLTIKDIEEIADHIERWGGDDFMEINGTTFRASVFAASALRHLLNERKWRPIDSAPSDGERILVWSSRYPPSDQVQFRLALGEFWRREKVGPSHWMPLPLPPEENGDV